MLKTSTSHRIKLINQQLSLQQNSCASMSAQVEKIENDVLYEVVDKIALITLNRPHRLNALTQAMQRHYFEALNRARDDPEVKVIVVTGAGRAFSAGADFDILDQIGKTKGNLVDSFPASLDQIQALEIPKPIIAAINGPCAGLGFVLATMADIRFSMVGAKFTTAFAKRGLVGEYAVTYTLPKIVGLGNAMDLMLSARTFVAEEAEKFGLVQKVFATSDELQTEVMKYAKEMAKWCSPASMAAMKLQLYGDFNKSYRQVHTDALKLMKKSLTHPDAEEGVQSYLKKREPDFQGLKYGKIHDL